MFGVAAGRRGLPNGLRVITTPAALPGIHERAFDQILKNHREFSD